MDKRAKYKEIASYYNRYRKADERLINKIISLTHISNKCTVLDVGAGTGNYSLLLADHGFNVIAVEPEIKMYLQCDDYRIKWIHSSAESIPLSNASVDCAIIVNAIHHFTSWQKALLEIERVVGHNPIVIVTFDPAVACKQWVFDYWPTLKLYENQQYEFFSGLESFIRENGKQLKIYKYNIPHDFSDCFSGALWKRPHLLIEPEVISCSSLMSLLDKNELYKGLELLKKDLGNDKWSEKYSYLLNQSEWDVGCRIVIISDNL